MIIERAPSGALHPFVKFLWASDDRESTIPAKRERMIPTGSMHVVFRLSNHPIRIFDSTIDERGQAFGFGVVAGLRSRYYIKDVCRPVRTVGAVLQPGMAGSLFEVIAADLAERHISIQELWGQSSIDLLEQLHQEGTLQQQLDVFESHLVSKIPQNGSVHPVVAYALKVIPVRGNISEIVRETGYSHKHFIELFRTAVGQSPGLYSRILRFQRALKRLTEPNASLVDIALQNAYSDQAHFNREFREIAGITPGEYRSSRTQSHHVPIPIIKR
ncbi:helix-turn-helix transcriptional regulator [bacterium]|nr:helix-turn-helix transcriptional regulator [bacterium]MCI0602443.1 helix-turn-helix transcriptional regulator [bacterium]